MILRLFRTARNLKLSQMFYYFIRRIVKYPRELNFRDKVTTRPNFNLSDPIPEAKVLYAESGFSFLNKKLRTEAGNEWCQGSMPMLWQYNLHYFDYLKQGTIGVKKKIELVEKWSSINKDISNVGWQPYPSSLRIVNWVFFLKEKEVRKQVTPETLTSLAQQAEWLSRNLEKHILANHLFENVRALLFSGVFFGEKFGDELLELGKKMFLHQISEQFLVDGMHYERSPMYHAIMLQSLLDISNLAVHNRECFEPEFVQEAVNVAKLALRAQLELTPPDESVPFFNDGANEIAPTTLQLTEYAEKLFGCRLSCERGKTRIYSLKEAGYHAISNEQNFIMIDCGDVGPNYQPGHTHCDMLSFEYWMKGEKVFTNCGTYDYELSPERKYSRSTAAHNTCTVDDGEQSEIWGAFRVGRRARIIQNEIFEVGEEIVFRGAHDGYRYLKGKVTHRRNLIYSNGETLEIKDEILGKGTHSVKSYLHLVSGYSFRQTEGGFNVVDPRDMMVCRIETSKNATNLVIQTDRYPEFGLKQTASTLVLEQSGELPIEFGYKIVTKSR